MSDPASTPPEQNETINFFRPRDGYMRREVVLICAVLLIWGGLTFGFQFLLLASEDTASGQGPLSESVVFGFPLHYWFTGQFLVLCFIMLCFFFNTVIDRLTRHFRQTDMRRKP